MAAEGVLPHIRIDVDHLALTQFHIEIRLEHAAYLTTGNHMHVLQLCLNRELNDHILCSLEDDGAVVEGRRDAALVGRYNLNFGFFDHLQVRQLFMQIEAGCDDYFGLAAH